MSSKRRRATYFICRILLIVFFFASTSSIISYAESGQNKHLEQPQSHNIELLSTSLKNLSGSQNNETCSPIDISNDIMHDYLKIVDENFFDADEVEARGIPQDNLENLINVIILDFRDKKWDEIFHEWNSNRSLWLAGRETLDNLPERSKLTLANALMQANANLSDNFSKPVPISWQDIYAVLSHSVNNWTSWSYGYIGYFFENVYNSIRALSSPNTSFSSWEVMGSLVDPFEFSLSLAKANTGFALCLAEGIRPDLGTSDRDGIYKWQWQLARLHSYEGSLLQAERMYRSALTTVTSIKREFVSSTDNSPGSEDIRFNFLERVESLYREYIDLLTKHELWKEANEKARETIISLQFSDLENLLDCEIDNSSFMNFEEAIEHSDSRTAIIYPVILNDRLEVLWKIPGQPLSRTTINDVSSEELENAIDKFRYELEKPYFSTRHGKPFAVQLYDWLIREVEQDIEVVQDASAKVKTLIFILDGKLRNVSMAALYDSAERKYLIQKYAIGLSLGGLQLPRSEPTKVYRALLAGLTVEPNNKPNGQSNNEQNEQYGALEYVDDELNRISEILPSSIIKAEEFNFRNLKNKISSTEFNIIHLATHGNFAYENTSPDSEAATYVLLAGSTADNKLTLQCIDEESKCFENLFEQNKEPIELMVLSACETAAGDERAILGIAGVAVKSGARSVLATLWSVNDLSSVLFMQKFYFYLNGGFSKAEALQKAQIDLLENEAAFRPSSWAPYVLVGDWR